MNPLWTQLAQAGGIELTPSQHQLLERYLQLLLEANQTLNLTRITDPDAARVQHVADALTLLPFLPAGAGTLADVGSGAGVPGLPLAIARPDLRITLIESTRKKAIFLRNTATALELKNVDVRGARAETIARTNRRESFDVVTARAVGAMVWLAEWCLPLVRVGGTLLAMKGARITEEMPAAAPIIRKLGGGEQIVHPVSLPGTEHHVIVAIKKLVPTHKKFPRDPTATRGKPMTL